MPYLRSQRADIARLLTDHTLDPANFEWTRGADEFELKHSQSHYFMRFAHDPNGWHLMMCPWIEEPAAETHVRDWGAARDVANQWIACVRRELESADPWSDILRDSDEAPFSPTEAAGIAAAIGRIEAHLLERYATDHELSASIRTDLHDLAEAARVERRGVWKRRAARVFEAIVLDLALNPEKAQALAAFVIHALSSAVHGAPLALPDLSLIG